MAMSPTTVLTLDLEATHLRGQAFALGATLSTPDGEVSAWTARCPHNPRQLSPFTRDHVLPQLNTMPVDATSYTGLLDQWRRIRAAHPDTWVVTHVPHPVETTFLLHAHPGTYEGPFPLVDVASMLAAHGANPTDLAPYAHRHQLGPDHGPGAHHPLWDARCTANVFWHLAGGHR